MSLSSCDLRTVLQAAGELNECRAGEVDVVTVLGSLARLIPSDGVSWSRLDLALSREVGGPVAIACVSTDSDDSEELGEAFWNCYKHPPVCHRRVPPVTPSAT